MLAARIQARASVCMIQFRDLRIIDCSHGSAKVELWPKYYPNEPEPSERERSVWTNIDLGFAEPVNRSDDVADYAPTQIIAELFKRAGYDCVKYRSALSEEGHNLALFDLTSAEPDLNSCTLFCPTKVNFEFQSDSAVLSLNVENKSWLPQHSRCEDLLLDGVLLGVKGMERGLINVIGSVQLNTDRPHPERARVWPQPDMRVDVSGASTLVPRDYGAARPSASPAHKRTSTEVIGMWASRQRGGIRDGFLSQRISIICRVFDRAKGNSLKLRCRCFLEFTLEKTGFEAKGFCGEIV
jgi:hypothetical protein